MTFPLKLQKALWIVSFPAMAIAAYWLVFSAPLPFVASWWDVGAERGTTFKTRYRIADRLATSGRLDDLNRQEVIALLGEPTNTDKWREHGLVYVLGPERSLIGLDYEWLLIDFDLSGMVSKVEVTSD